VRGLPTVWHVAREYAGLAEAGGVKDVVRGLAEAQARAGMHVSVVLPLYGFLSAEFRAAPALASFSVRLPDQDKGNTFFDEPVQVRAVTRERVRLLLVDSPRFAAARDVYTYTAADEQENHWKKKGTGHWDFHQLNLILQRSALETALFTGEKPQVFHCHDGHTAFLPALLREEAPYAGAFGGSSALVTIHNAGPGYHQEVWDRDFARLLTGLPDQCLDKGVLNGKIDPLLLAGSYARLVTVSERYAEEMLAEKDSEIAGGLGRALRDHGIPLAGITNGIDPSPWDPRLPGNMGLPFAYDPLNGDLEGKRKCREALAQKLDGAAATSGPLYAFVGRLTGQKGIDILFQALKDLVRGDASHRFVILGQGEKEMEAMLSWLSADAASGGRFSFIPRYDPSQASLIYASSDFFLIPSAYEPCGLTDFIAQLLGSIPIVHRVGGLVKVRDNETGFAYDEHSPAALISAVERTSRLFVEDRAALERIRRTAFAEVFSLHTWDRVFSVSYLPLYLSLVNGTSWTQR
jgi:starch synthase